MEELRVPAHWAPAPPPVQHVPHQTWQGHSINTRSRNQKYARKFKLVLRLFSSFFKN